MIWCLENYKGIVINGMKIELNDLILSIKDCVKSMKQGNT